MYFTYIYFICPLVVLERKGCDVNDCFIFFLFVKKKMSLLRL